MTEPRPDTLNEIGVLRRREIEARIVAPLLERFGQEFGVERVNELARDVIAEVARNQGRQLAAALGDHSLAAFAGGMGNWSKGDALTVQVRTLTDDEYALRRDPLPLRRDVPGAGDP